jgi:DNA sulfur modification protein DndB
MTTELLRLDSQFTYSFSATRGHQHKPYFQATIPASILVKMLRLDNQGSTLERSQREVNQKRAEKFGQYLKKNLETKDFFIIPSLVGYIETPNNSPAPRFFNAYELLNVKRASGDFKGLDLGQLMIHFDSTIKLFDGQHRGTGVSIGLDLMAQDDSLLRAVSVPIMLYTDLTLRERQLGFTDINMNLAKPQASISLAYDKRDPISQLAVDLSSSLPCFQHVVDFERSVVNNKSEYLFPLKTVYDCVATLLNVKGKNKETSITNEQRERVSEILITMSRVMGWSGLGYADQTTEFYRDHFVFTHAVMIKAAAKAGYEIDQAFKGIENADLDGLKALDFDRYSEDFNDRCICKKTGNMIANNNAVRLAANKLMLAVGCPLPEKDAELERKFFGDFEQPVIAQPEPETPEDPRELLTKTEKLENIITSSNVMMMITTESIDITAEQSEEAADKLVTILSEPNYGGVDGLSGKNDLVYPELTRLCIEDYRELLKGDKPENEKIKVMLNMRSLRAYLRQAPHLTTGLELYRTEELSI